MILEQEQIAEILPQKYPFLMIDRVVDFKKDESLTAIKNITGNEWCFEGESIQSNHCLGKNKKDQSLENETSSKNLVEGRLHFPETLLIEAAAQAALMLYQLSKIKKGERKPKYVLGKISVKFDSAVFIGDQINIKAFANKMLDSGGYSDVELKRDSKKFADIEIIYSVIR